LGCQEEGYFVGGYVAIMSNQKAIRVVQERIAELSASQRKDWGIAKWQKQKAGASIAPVTR